VEDDEPVREVIGELLSREGYTVFSAEDGLEAASLLADISPDLVLTDHSMPRMDGWDLALLIRRRSPDTPVMLITGDCERLARRANHSWNPFDATLAKPFQLDTLLSTIHALLNRGVQTERSHHGPELSYEYQS